MWFEASIANSIDQLGGFFVFLIHGHPFGFNDVKILLIVYYMIPSLEFATYF
jgi:hypothetical protein